MNRKKSVGTLCAMLFIVAVIIIACTAKSGNIREPAVVEMNGSPASSALPDPAPTREGSLQPAITHPPQGDGGSSVNADGAGETNPTPVPATVTPAPTATPKPVSTPAPVPSSTPKPTATPEPEPTPRPTEPPSPTSTPQPTKMPEPTNTPTPHPTAQPTPTSTPRQGRTICNICGADITGDVPAHGDSHLLNDEDFSYRVE
jgi:outer membrane biosynthesis protein TonB